MNEVTITINEKTYKLGFSLSLFRMLGKKWNLPGINEVVVKMGVLDLIGDNPSFEALDVLEDVILAAITVGENCALESLQNLAILDEFFKNPKLLEDFKTGLIASLPSNNQDKTEGKI